MSFVIGEDVDYDDFINNCDGRLVDLSNDKWLVIDFCEFQYGKLSESSAPHRSYIKAIKKHGIENWFNDLIVDQSSTISSQRKRLSQKVKDKIFVEDKGKCQYCEDNGEVIDHIISLSKGGTNEDINLTTCCIKCNSKKSDLDVLDFIKINNIKPLNNLNKKLSTLFKGLYTLKEKDKDKDKDKNKDKDKEKEKALIFPFDSENFLMFWDAWRTYKKEEHSFKYASIISEQAALKQLSGFSNGYEEIAIKIIEQSIANGWKGFFELKINNNGQGKQTITGAIHEQFKDDPDYKAM